MNLKEKIFGIIFFALLCLSLNPSIKTVYAYEDDWDELQKNVVENVNNYNSEAFTITMDGTGKKTITLLKDIKAENLNHDRIKIFGSINVILDLNGHTLDVNNAEPIDDGSVIEVSQYARLHIKGPGTIAGGNTTGNGGGINCTGKLSLENVTIKNCYAKNGGAIYFNGRIVQVSAIEEERYDYYDLNATSLIIDNCHASENGGGIWGQSHLNLTNVYVINSSAVENGGGIYLAKDPTYGADVVDKCSRVEMAGSYFGDNIDNCQAKNGSAIYVEDDAVCTLANGVKIKNCLATEEGTIYCEGVLGLENVTVSDNKAQLGGGIFLKGSAFLGRSPVIKDNKNGLEIANNLYLTNEGKIIFGSGSDVPLPASTMDVNISLESSPSFGQAINISDNGVETYKNYIHIDNNSPDDPNRVYIIFDGNKFVVYIDEFLPVVRTSSSPKKYKLDKSETKHGDFTLSKSKASKGSKVTVTVSPDKGFVLETILVYDEDGNDIDVKNVEENKYEFTMPKNDVNVEVTFMEDNSMLNFCVDVKATDSSYDAIKWAYENGITKGIDDVTFGKEIEITRAQAVTFLHRAVGTPTDELRPDVTFTDVVKGEYYEDAVAWAANNNITLGTGDNLFDPDKICSVGEIAVMLERFKNLNNEEGLNNKPYEELANSLVDNYYNQLELSEKQFCNRETAVQLLYMECGNKELTSDNK